jgi:two-component system, NtrC family, nitrogen regulation sensor histidine kinase NtrY
MGDKTNRRKIIVMALAGSVLILFTLLAYLQAGKLQYIEPATTGQIFVFTGLSILAFILFVAVLMLLVRNVLKLYADQRSRVMGTRLRVRMLWGAVLVSLIPIFFMFFFSYGLMNRAVERWFSGPVTRIPDYSNRLALDISRYSAANARAEADSIAASLPEVASATEQPVPEPAHTARHAASHSTPGEARRLSSAASGQSREETLRVLRQHEITLQNGFAMVFRNGHLFAAYHMPQQTGATAQVKSWLPGQSVDEEGNGAAPPDTEPTQTESAPTASAILTAAQRSDDPVFSIGPVDYALATASLRKGEVIVVGQPLPFGMTTTMANLKKAADSYWAIFRARNQLRYLYMLLLLMMTSLALFASSWLALHLSKQVTKPVEALADAMEAIAAGDYAHRVGESATDELGDLVRRFNHMASDLENSRLAVEQSTVQLSAANSALEARRGELETMLETIPNGVATLDPGRRIILTNRALSEMMDPGGQRPFLGRPIDEVFPAELTELLDRLVLRSHRMGSASSEIELAHHTNDRFGGNMNLLATVALLEVPGNRHEHQGYVLVLENATELFRAQKQSAWKEVARRVAHEIKNPLTPISLSSEQIHRHINRLDTTLSSHQVESPSIAVIRRCSEVITSSVESMRSLVDQFAALAEFPTARPRPADLNTIVENSLALFAGRLQNIRIVRRFGTDLPLIMADPEALKRALGNLVDNAAEAMQNSLLRELHITTSLHDRGMVELVVADTGTGLTDDMRERLFLPYFSTKQRGTGLGLSIAAKIIQEHQGSIRAEKNEPAGARFIVELKAAAAGEGETETALATVVTEANGYYPERRKTPREAEAQPHEDLTVTTNKGQQ